MSLFDYSLTIAVIFLLTVILYAYATNDLLLGVHAGILISACIIMYAIKILLIYFLDALRASK